jgi:hypothetical protein
VGRLRRHLLLDGGPFLLQLQCLPAVSVQNTIPVAASVSSSGEWALLMLAVLTHCTHTLYP